MQILRPSLAQLTLCETLWWSIAVSVLTCLPGGSRLCEPLFWRQVVRDMSLVWVRLTSEGIQLTLAYLHSGNSTLWQQENNYFHHLDYFDANIIYSKPPEHI